MTGGVGYGVYPLFVIMGGAVLGASWYLSRLATRPDVVWSRKQNPAPWLSVQPHQTVKMYDPQGRFSAGWKRE